jgi:acyl-coenzyme A thioesterase PaaI-like protein
MSLHIRIPLISLFNGESKMTFLEKLRATLGVRTFAFFKIPLIFYVSPFIEEFNNKRIVVRIPLKRRTRNHLKSMYFGVLATGADCAGGLMAMRLIQESGRKVSLVFKDFKAEFLKRAEGDVLFTCEDGAAIRALVARALASDDRVNDTVHVTATVPSLLGAEPVALFELTLSLKKRS